MNYSEADNIRSKRGFESFSKWASENRKGVKYWRSSQARKDHPDSEHEAMARSLDSEYETMIKPNL